MVVVVVVVVVSDGVVELRRWFIEAGWMIGPCSVLTVNGMSWLRYWIPKLNGCLIDVNPGCLINCPVSMSIRDEITMLECPD